MAKLKAKVRTLANKLKKDYQKYLVKGTLFSIILFIEIA